VIRAVRRAAPFIALILLAWTAIDLVDPQCCLSDRAANGTMAISASTSPDGDSPDQGQIDDCFCCARCLDTGRRVPRFDVAMSHETFDEPAQRLIRRSSSLDHPPQNA
jgi:hypothetical protein